MRKPVKILLQRADRLGDMVCTLPMIEHIKARYPEAEIHVLASSRNADLVRTHPLVRKVQCYDVHAGSLKKYIAFIKLIRQEKYALYISVWNNVWMALLGVFAKIPKRIGDSSNLTLKWVYTDPVFQDWNDISKHQIDHNLDLLAPLYISTTHMLRRLPLSESALERMRKTLIQSLDHHKKVIFIFCHTGGSNQALSEEILVAFIDKILAVGLYSIVLCGGTGNETGPLAEKTSHDLLNFLKSPLDLESLKALISLSDMYVGPDTGPTHLASFLNIPLLCYYLSKTTYPTRFGPLSDYQHILRLDYIDPALDARSSHIDAETLYHGWCALVDKLQQQNALDEKSKRLYLMENSLRILYLLNRRDPGAETSESIRSLRREGLIVFPFRVRETLLDSLVPILRLMKQRNITVIQGRKLPLWFRGVVRFLRATLYQTHRPGFVPVNLHHYISKEDYLLLYAAALKNMKSGLDTLYLQSTSPVE